MDQWKRANTNIGTNNFTANATVATFNYPCLDNSDCTYYYSTLPAGYYKFEVWGAEGGGSNCGSGYYYRLYPAQGKGGYSVGVYKLDSPSQVNVFVGGRGEDSLRPSTRDAKGGYNGGGDSSLDSGDTEAGGAGGGASDIRVNGISTSDRVIVAGGAGGNGYDTCWQQYTNCGYGGGETAGPPYEYGQNSGTPASQTVGLDTGIGEKGIFYRGGSSGGGGGGYRGGYTIATRNNGGSGGGGSGFIGRVISFQGIEKKTVPGNQPIVDVNGKTKTGNWGHGAARITLLGYSISIKTKIEPRYDPNSTLEIEYSLTTMGKGEQATVTRIILGIETKVVLIHNDMGIESVHKDSIPLPNISGDIKITYKVESLSGSVTSTSFNSTITKLPNLTILSKIKPEYIANETLAVIAEIDDDTYACIRLYIDDVCIKCIQVFPYNRPTRSIIEFSIPDHPIGSKHTISFVAKDEFHYYSNFSNFTYTLIKNNPPEVTLNSSILYYQTENTEIDIKVMVKDLDRPPFINVRTQIDTLNYVQYEALESPGSSWNDYSFICSIPYLYEDIHNLTIYAVDEHETGSNIILHQFAIEPRVNCKCKTRHANNALFCSDMRYTYITVILFI